MIVTKMGQAPGAAHAAPRPSGGPPPPVRGADALDRSGAAANPASQALFDANGDGTIENWGFAHGGDSFATFDPPPPGTDMIRPHRNADTPSESDLHVASPSHNPGHSGTPAAIHHAHDAYRRDGLAGAPSQPVTHDGPTPGAQHLSPAPTPPVPQPAPTAALPSAR